MKRTISLLLALLLLLSLSACSGTPDSAAQPQGDPQTDAPAETPDASSDASEEPAATSDGTAAIALPLTETPVTYKIWNTYSMTSLPITNFSENHTWQELESRTGVHIEWTHSSSPEEQFNLSLVSGDWYDSYWQAPWAGSLDYYIEEDMVLDLTDLIPTLAPHFDALRRTTNDGYKSTLTDAGRSAAFYEAAQSLQSPYVGPVIRKDFLDRVGKAVPQTYDELHDVLTAFRDELNLEIPLAITPSGIDDWLSAGMGTVYATWFNEEFYQVDGVMTFGPTTQEFRDYIQLLAGWYAEGLIDPEFYGRVKGFYADSASTDSDLMSQDMIGAGRSMYGAVSTLPQLSSNPDYELVPLAPITKTAGEQILFVIGGGSVTYMSLYPSVIMTTCENPELLIRWFDYLYSDEGSLLLNYGIAGDDYVLNESGEPRLSEKIYNNPDGLALNQALLVYTGSGTGGPWNYDWTREITTPNTTALQLSCRQTWADSIAEEHCSVASLTISEENADRYNSIMADVRTCVSENLARFITGEKNMDSDWDAFQSTLSSMGIEEAVAMQQEAYDNFQHRGE